MIRIRIERSLIGHHPVTNFGFSNGPLMMNFMALSQNTFSPKTRFSKPEVLPVTHRVNWKWLIINESVICFTTGMRKMCFPRKIAFDQHDFIDATDFYLRRRILKMRRWMARKSVEPIRKYISSIMKFYYAFIAW